MSSNPYDDQTHDTSFRDETKHLRGVKAQRMPMSFTDREENGRKVSSRRNIIKYVGSLSAVGIAGCLGGDGDDGGTGSEDYPSENIQHIVPNSAGGGTDSYARQIVPEAGDVLGVDIEIENMEGAGGLRGVGQAALSDPDGHTTFNANLPAVPVAWLGNPQDEWELDEIKAVGSVGFSPTVIVADAELGFDDFEALVDAYQSGDLNTIGSQAGDLHRVRAETAREWGWEWEEYVPYDGSGEIHQAIASGEIPASITTDGSAQALVEDGEEDVLLATHPDGSDIFPDAPTTEELGLTDLGFMMASDRGIFMPPDTPDEIIDVFADALQEAIESDPVTEWQEESGRIVRWNDGETVQESLHDSLENIPDLIDMSILTD